MLEPCTLANGLRVLTAVMPHSRSTTVSFYVGAGARYEQPAEAGISHLVEHVCFKGSERRRTAQQISEAIEGVGGVLNAGTDREFTVYYAKVPAAHLDLALDVVLDLVLRPLFDGDELEKERRVILEELAMVEDHPSQLVELALDGLLWPGQALGRDVAGTPDSVRSIPRDRAVSYRRDHYTPDNAVLAVAGAVDPQAVVDIVQAATERWDFGNPGPREQAASWPDAQPAGRRIGLRSKPTEQAHLMVGLPGLSLEDPDRYALGLLTGVLGEGMSSRLFVELREERALVYDVQAYATQLCDTGALSIYLGVDPDNALPAMEIALHELGRMRQGVPPAELAKIREYTKGRMLLNLEDTRAVSAWYGGQALLQRRMQSVEEIIAAIDAVTDDDLVRVADALIRDERLHLALVGPFETIDSFVPALHL